MANVTEPYTENELPLTESQKKRLERIHKNIDYIKQNTDSFKTIIRDIFTLDMIDEIDNTLDEILFSELQLKVLRNINHLQKYDQALEKFKTSINALFSNRSDNNQDLLIDSAENIKNVIDEIKKTIYIMPEEENQKIKNTSKDDSYIEALKDLEFRFSNFYEILYPSDIEDIKKKIENSESEQKFNQKLEEIDKKSSDSQELFKEAQKSFLDSLNAEGLLNKEIQELKKAKEGHIAYTLSDKLEDKLSNCRIDKYIKLVLLCVVIIGMLIINYNLLDFSAESIKESKFWELLAMKLLFNIPLAFLVIFFLNEYNKAKRLFEEFDYKIIMAQTLMNNYNRLKEDFTQDQDKLLDLLKAPIEKIFENPVRNVFGDNGGDKGLGIDQLEKIVSIASKLKDKKD